MVRLKFAMMVLMAVATLKIWIQHQWPEFLPQNNSGMILSIVKMEVRNKIGSQCVRAVFSSPFYSPSSLHWGQQIFIGSQQPKVLPSERKRYQPPHLKTFLITKVYLESNHSQCLQIRDALQYQIVCFFQHCFGGDQTHVQEFLLQILYTSGRYLAL